MLTFPLCPNKKFQGAHHPCKHIECGMVEKEVKIRNITTCIISWLALSLIYDNCESNNSTIFISSVHLRSFLFQKWPLMDYELITTAMTIYRTTKVRLSRKIFMEEGKGKIIVIFMGWFHAIISVRILFN